MVSTACSKIKQLSEIKILFERKVYALKVVFDWTTSVIVYWIFSLYSALSCESIILFDLYIYKIMNLYFQCHKNILVTTIVH